MKHLFCIGAVYLDTILSVPFFPEEDAKLRATKLQIRRGGNVGNSLEVLQRLLRHEKQQNEIDLHLITCLPNKTSLATGKVLSSFGHGSAIDFSRCLYRADKTEAANCYILRSRSSGSRTIVNFNDLDEMTLPEFIAVADQFGDEPDSWWHFEGRLPDVTLACIGHIRQAMPQANVSVEIEKPDRGGLRELAAEADVVFYSRTWAETHGYSSAEACLKGETCPRAFLTLCTWGAEGAAALSLADGTSSRCRAKPITEVVDSIGAGDTFVAGILYRLLRNIGTLDVGEALRFAVHLAGKKVEIEGFDMIL